MKKIAVLLLAGLAACRSTESAEVPQDATQPAARFVPTAPPPPAPPPPPRPGTPEWEENLHRHREAAAANPHMQRVVRFQEEARPIAERLREDPAFAGFVFKNEPEPYAIVLFTGDAEARLRRYTTDPRFRAKQATLTDDELRALQQSFGERLNRLGIHWGASWGEDEHNRVVFQVPEMEKIERAVAEGRLTIPPNVRIEHQPGTIARTPQTAGPVTYFPQFRYPAAVSMQALASGVLQVRNGCLFLEGMLILWPSGARLSLDPHGVPVVNGELRAGERIEIGGGTAPDGFDGSGLLQPIPARCRGPMWIAAG